MPELDDLIRDSLRAHEVEAPGADGLLDAVHSRISARSRRHRWAVIAAAAASVAVVAAAGAVAGGVVGSDPGIRRDAGKGADTPPRPYTAPGMRSVSFHGLEILVPAGWRNTLDSRCPANTVDSVQFQNSGMQLGCNQPEPPGISVVRLLAAGPTTHPGEANPHQPTTVDGVPALHDELRHRDGRTEVAVAIPSLDVRVLAVSPDPALARRVIASIRVRPVDSRGCRDPLATDAPASSGDSGSLVPPDPVGAVVCRYETRGTPGQPVRPRLVRSTALSTDEARRYARLLERGAAIPAPPPPARPSGTCAGDSYLVRFRYADRPPAEVLAGTWNCNPLAPPETVTNGTRATGVEPELAELLRLAWIDGRLTCRPDRPPPRCGKVR
jgi:hypothetical protein